MSESAKLRVYTPEGNAKRSSAFKGRKHSEETIKKMSASQKGRTFTDEHKNKLKLSHKGMTGKSFNAESRQRMSDAQKKPPVTCPHCGKTGKGNCMKRWHFDNCKSRVL